ncbi:MAG: alpha/beta fold hydrolase [Runella slithyformis]|nr:MAG: alpha/beta fold hydrolase [Runella slithyformis]TAF27418.1 MAG: alpha/beta fold hydrolase [Runella slithyformis]TAF45982.1 MAG: alpha/beta fold hydrolase [Runella slithyformis]
MPLPLLLMIPGTLCDATLFEPQIAALSDLAHCQVVNHSVADNLVEVARHILCQTEGHFAVMGLSYGGIIAFELWRQAPHRISKMILLNTNHRLPSETTRATQQRFLGMAALGEFRAITTDFLKDAMLHPKHAALPEMREKVLKMAINTGEEAFFSQIKAQLNRPDSTPDLPHIQCPVLVVTGREDKVCTPQIHQEMVSLMPNAMLAILEECGHLSTLEQPHSLNEIIRKWWTATT